MARLIPEGHHSLEEVRKAVAGIREIQAGIRQRSQESLSYDEVRSAIEEGRAANLR